MLLIENLDGDSFNRGALPAETQVGLVETNAILYCKMIALIIVRSFVLNGKKLFYLKL
jgi:hypothetical protein